MRYEAGKEYTINSHFLQIKPMVAQVNQQGADQRRAAGEHLHQHPRHRQDPLPLQTYQDFTR